jgi:RHS repeat-associated protein
VYYVHTDHLTTPRRLTRPSDGEVVWRWDSDPFGTTTANEDPDGDSAVFEYNLRFPGQYWDVEGELSYNYFRDYDPYTGRYIESDPIGLGGGVNTSRRLLATISVWARTLKTPRANARSQVRVSASSEQH